MQEVVENASCFTLLSDSSGQTCSPQQSSTVLHDSGEELVENLHVLLMMTPWNRAWRGKTEVGITGSVPHSSLWAQPHQTDIGWWLHCLWLPVSQPKSCTWTHRRDYNLRLLPKRKCLSIPPVGGSLDRSKVKPDKFIQTNLKHNFETTLDYMATSTQEYV